MIIFTFVQFSAFASEEEPVLEDPHEADSFWDRSYFYLAEKFHEPTLWFDNFFGDPRIEYKDQPSTYVRLRNTVKFTESEGFTFPIRLRASVRLPKASHRLRLVIIGESEDELKDQRTVDTGVPGLNQDAENRTNVGLRYTIYDTLRDHFHFGGGLRVKWPVESYVRMRYERLLHIGSNNIIRFSETGFFHSQDGFGETSRFDFERRLRDIVSNRISIFGTHSETSQGVDWGFEESLFVQLSPQKAVSFDLGAYGDTRPNTVVNNYRIGTRYRQNILRPWLFFEVEPEVNFILDDVTGERNAVGAITFVLEIQFIHREDDPKTDDR